MEVSIDHVVPRRLRESSRATIVLGTASLFSGVGYIVGWFVPFERAQTFPDYAPFAATGGLIGAGLGWALGTAAGISISTGNRRAGPRLRALLWIVPALALIAATVIATHEDRLVVTWIITERELAWLRAATLFDGMLVAGTVVLTSLLGPTEDRTPVGAGGAAACLVAIALLSAAFLMSVGYVALDHRRRIDARSGMDARTAMYGLLEAARLFYDERGRFPDGVSELLIGRKPVRHSAQVAFVGPVCDGFCVVVGIDERREEPGEPIWPGITRVNGAGNATAPRSVRSCQVLR